MTPSLRYHDSVEIVLGDGHREMYVHSASRPGDADLRLPQSDPGLVAGLQPDLGMPLHYLVADRSGDAFVWERGPGGDEHVVRVDGGALCVTNHLLHRHPDPAELPADDAETMLTYQRYRTISERSAGAGHAGVRMRAALDAVRVDAAADTPYPLRTLWRTVLDLDSSTMATQFYLGDAADGAPRYSPELEFAVMALSRR